jgi:peptidoglycan hydrolase CwlO-like protein
LARALYALGRFCARVPLVVIGIWVLIAILVGGLVARVGSETSNDLTLPGTGSQSVKDLLQDRFPPQQNGANPIVFNVKTGKLTDDANKQAIKESVQAMRKAPHVYSVTNPLSSGGQTAGLLSKDKQTAFAPVIMNVGSGDLTDELAHKVFDSTEPAQKAGITVAAAASIGTVLSEQPTESSEVIGILAAMLILTLVLGSLIAMGMPIITAIVGLATALFGIGLLGHAVAMPSTGPTLATMIGLGVGIDYALFLITRHQDNLKDGMEMEESIAHSVATSGSAIVFAGSTVVVALVSLRVAGIPLLSTLGLASALAVVTAVLGAISLLPALLGLLKHRIHWLSLPGFLHRNKEPGSGMWASWAKVIAKYPLWITIGAVIALAPLIAPAPSLAFGQEDIGATNPDTTERQAYDLISAGFGVGYNGPLQVASKLDPVAAPSQEYTSKYNQATSLKKKLDKAQKQLPKQQKQLEQQQKQLEAEQKSLENQQDALLKEQSALEASAARLQSEQASLERQKAQLEQQKAQLEAKQARLEAKKSRLQARRDVLHDKRVALVAEARPLIRQLARIAVRERVLNRRIDRLDGHPRRQARLRARLAKLQIKEDGVRQQLAPLKAQGERLFEQAEKLAEQAEKLAAQGAKLQQQADQLQQEGDALQAQAARLKDQGAHLKQQKKDLQKQGNSLKRQGNQLQKQGDALQQQANELKAEQQQAEQEQKQAEKLQKQLTAMVTTAGGDPRGTDPRIVDLQNSLSATSGVKTLTPPQLNKHGDVVMLSAVPTTSPSSDETTDLLATVRNDVIPKVEDKGGITSYVGGFTASYVDLAELISKRLLLVIATVILLGFVLLMIAFRCRRPSPTCSRRPRHSASSRRASSGDGGCRSSESTRAATGCRSRAMCR